MTRPLSLALAAIWTLVLSVPVSGRIIVIPGQRNAERFTPIIPKETDHCRVILRRAHRQTTAPCGQPIEPEGYDEILLEHNDRITPFPTDVPKNPVSPLVLPVSPAGIVVADARSHLVEYTNLQPVVDDEILRRAFQRTAEGSAPVRVPIGRTVAVVRDARGRASSVSRPFTVSNTATNVLEPRAPTEGADLVVWLSRDRHQQLGDAALVLERDTGVLPPDVYFVAADRIMGIWYGLSAGIVRIQFKSPTHFVDVPPIRIVSRSVHEFAGVVREKPSLAVRTGTHAIRSDVSLPPVTLALFDDAAKTTIRTVTPIVGEETRFAHLPPLPLRVVLTIGSWKTARMVDLSSGENADIELAIEPILVKGTVYAGEQAIAATVGVWLDDAWREVETDDSGVYELLVWEDNVYGFRIVPKDHATPELATHHRITNDTTLDFHIPTARVDARVIDASTGAGIAQATISLLNIWSEDNGEKRYSAIVVTNGDGVAALPALRAGSLELRANAQGFLPSDVVRKVVADNAQETIPIKLQKEEKGSRIAIRLPDGTPALGAEAVGMDRSGAIVWRTTTDDDAELHVPLNAQGTVAIVRHAQAATMARATPTHDEEWRLGAPAPALALRVQRINGTPPQDGWPLHISLWLDGVRLAGPAASFAAWSNTWASTDGFWLARNLPQTQIRALAYEPSDELTLRAGMYDALASTIPFPWHATVMLTAPR